ncbi:Interferon-induced GTP-binding protein MxB [Diplodia seriata]|uniref:Interferon-induced GTP-binding protein MxB n=1 Tax=Diplodia seriata TaxID=420778 RepID=A0A1S8BM19_9PEZI|nr:Interferon-induced GTP-binding protein MxB [Diplodia seriata]
MTGVPKKKKIRFEATHPYRPSKRTRRTDGARSAVSKPPGNRPGKNFSAHVQASAKFSPFQNDSMRSLLSVVDELRHVGLNHVLSLPQLVVCGDQSSGKSSVLEAMTRIPFPRDAMLCTRFATEVNLCRDPEQSITAKIVPGDTGSTAHRDKLLAFRKSMTDYSELPDLMREATKLMESADPDANTPKLTAFFSHMLSITVSGPEYSPLTLVDLPGLIHTETASQSKHDVDFIDHLVQDYIANPRSIILAVVSAKHDYANQIILQKARGVDPHGSRTLGIITKPDCLDEGSSEEQQWTALAKNEDIHFKLGWHMLRNRAQMETLSSFEERDSTEKAFFEHRAIYRDMDKDTLGIGPLSERLTRLLHAHLKREMPKLNDELKAELAKASQRLAVLGGQREAVQDMRAFLMESGTKCNGLITDALNGQYNDDFFRDGADAVSEPVMIEKLRSTLRYHTSQFTSLMLVFGSKYKFNGVPSDILAIIGTEKDVDINDRLDYMRLAAKLQKVLTRSGAISWAYDKMVACRGEELPGTVSVALMKELFWEQSSNWKAITLSYIDVIAKHVQEFLTRLIQHVMPPEVAERVSKWKIPSSVASQKDNAIAELDRIVKDNRGAPMTYNHYYTDMIQKLRHQKLMARAKSITDSTSYHIKGSTVDSIVRVVNPETWLDTLNKQSIEQDMDKFTAEEALDSLMALYKDKLKVFIARVAEEVIERHLVAPLVDSPVSPVTLMKLSDDEVRYLAAEPEHVRTERAQLLAMKDSLEEGKKAFARALI